MSWLGFDSESFVAYNGVKQGGVLSPVLFCIYIDILLLELSRAGLGCHIGIHYVGALAYADDIVLVAPTPTAMRDMLSICDRFAGDYDVRFNATKSKCVIFHSKRMRHGTLHKYERVHKLEFKINSQEIEILDQYKHLGHIINSELDDADDINDKRAAFIGQANNVICYFGKVNAYVRQQLFNSYCTSFFACELWRLDHNSIDKLCTAWRCAIRRVWSLPSTTHNDLLPIISNLIPLHDEICGRFLSFVGRCLSHPSHLVSGIASHGVLYARALSPIGRNVMVCRQRYRFRSHDLLSGRINAQYVKTCLTSTASDNACSVAKFLIELVGLREKTLFFAPDPLFLTPSEISDMILSVATK